MQKTIVAIAAGLALALAAVAASSPASARGLGNHWGGGHGSKSWGGGHWGGRPQDRGGAYLGGLAAGAIIGGALAAPYGYFGPYAYEPGYDYGPDVYVQPDDSVAYCMQRFRSYNPASGTYLGYDGKRHPCP
ncbi:MAG: BA14K family protein [Pseudorhodoplanes sp.]|nr:BA14K family protein [Pseudorhodoplanes sp.]